MFEANGTVKRIGKVPKRAGFVTVKYGENRRADLPESEVYRDGKLDVWLVAAAVSREAGHEVGAFRVASEGDGWQQRAANTLR